MAKRLGVDVETVAVSSAERIPMLKDGKLDFVATSMTRTPERLKEVDFSVIYFITPHAVIVRKSSGITSVRQLAGKKASSASTSTAGPNLKEAEPKVELVYVRDYAEAFGLLKDGKVDAFPTDESVLRAIVQQDGHPNDYLFLSDFTKSRNVGFALKQNEPRFKDADQPRPARHRGVRRSRQNLRRLVRAEITRADAAQVQDPAETRHAPVFVARSKAAQPIWFVDTTSFAKVLAKLDQRARAFVKAAGFEPKPGRHLCCRQARTGGVLFGIERRARVRTRSCPACCRRRCRREPIASPTRRMMCGLRRWRSRSAHIGSAATARRKDKAVRLVVPEGVDGDDLTASPRPSTLARDLINTPANDMGPAELKPPPARSASSMARNSAPSSATTCSSRTFR